jgi:peptide/nickel transport system substrate-binding protein
MPELADASMPTDTEKAKQNCSAKAGYPDGFTFTITVPSNYQQHVDTAQVLSEEFKKIGVNVTIRGRRMGDVAQRRIPEARLSTPRSSAWMPVNPFRAGAARRALSARLQTISSNYSNAEYDSTYAQAVRIDRRCRQNRSRSKSANRSCPTTPPTFISRICLILIGMNSRVTGYTFYPLYVCDLSGLKLAQ